MGRLRRYRARWALAGTLATVAAAVVLFVLLFTTGGEHRPSAPSCGSPQTAHTAAIDSDPVVRCFLQAAATCTARELDVNGNMQDTSVDEHFLVAPGDRCRIDDYVTHYLNGLGQPNTSLDFRCTSFAQLPDWGLVLTGCTPPVQCYEDLGAPILDPPPVSPSPSVAPGAPEASPTPSPAGPGTPAQSGHPHC